MGPATTTLADRARTIFDQLGYTLSDGREEFRAERAWKSVRVTTTTEPEVTPSGGDLRCFVTYREVAEDLRTHLLDRKPPYDWAIISVDEGTATDGGYEVIHPPAEVVR